MNITVGKSLATFDEKISMNLLDSYTDNMVGALGKFDLNNYKIYTIDNFLQDGECDNIIEACENVGFGKLNYDTEYRESERIITFDQNGALVQTINNRLTKINKKLDKNKIKPYGFFSDQYKWSDIIGINECLRINKYITGSNGFDYHRDAQYTYNNVRSVYSIIVYLSNCDTGDVEFIVPNNYYINNGKNMDEEMKLIKKSFETCVIKPKKGMAIIFDQRIIHRAYPYTDLNPKYVLRTDLLVQGIKKDSYKENKNELKIMELAKKLFRQAQYYELNNRDCKNLYEICISLRQQPTKIKTYPKKLEQLLCDIDVDLNIGKYTLTLVSRSGDNYLFKYDDITNLIDIYNALRVCIAVLMSSVNCSLTNKQVIYDNYFDKMDINSLEYKLKNLQVSDGGNSESSHLFVNFETYYYSKYNEKPKENIRDELDDEFNEYLTLMYKLQDVDRYDSGNFAKFEIDRLTYKEKQDGHCGLSDDSDSMSGDEYSYPSTESIVFNNDNFGIMFEPLLTDADVISGNAYINAIGDTFNHASCNCETILKYIGSSKNYKTINVKIEYDVDLIDKKIKLTYVPMITM